MTDVVLNYQTQNAHHAGDHAHNSTLTCAHATPIHEGPLSPQAPSRKGITAPVVEGMGAAIHKQEALAKRASVLPTARTLHTNTNQTSACSPEQTYSVPVVWRLQLPGSKQKQFKGRAIATRILLAPLLQLASTILLVGLRRPRRLLENV